MGNWNIARDGSRQGVGFWGKATSIITNLEEGKGVFVKGYRARSAKAPFALHPEWKYCSTDPTDQVELLEVVNKAIPEQFEHDEYKNGAHLLEVGIECGRFRLRATKLRKMKFMNAGAYKKN